MQCCPFSCCSMWTMPAGFACQAIRITGLQDLQVCLLRKTAPLPPAVCRAQTCVEHGSDSADAAKPACSPAG